MDSKYTPKDALKLLKECSYFSLGFNGTKAEAIIGPEKVKEVKELAVAALEAQVSDETKFKCKSKDDLSLKDLVKLGYEQGLVKLIVSDGVVCQIGENRFYFGGESAEGYDSVDKFKEDIPVEDFLDDIYITLHNFEKNTGMRDEYQYYVTYIKDNLQYDSTLDRLHFIFKNIIFKNQENGTAFRFDTQFNDYALKQIAEKMIEMGVTFK
ncbi:MAG: hypothetical protein IJA32_11005 [Lachnospiraceae bacterium]|nr:hypothetical protein [Lachnospiraceae bacterium]